MIQTPEYRAFLAQKYTSRQRGISFEFSFDEWVEWWEDHLGPDWFKKRGRKRGLYVMARLKDKGPYKIENVKCILHSENVTDQVANGTSNFGEKHGGVKLTEDQAMAIRKANGTLGQISSKYALHKSTVQYIKDGKLWSHLSTPITPYIRERYAQRKLTAKDAIDIFQAVGTREEIAERYGITGSNVAAIRKGQSWAHATASLEPRQGRQDFRVKLSDDQVRTIFYDKRDRHTIAKEYGVAPITVWEIKHKVKRKKVTADL